jgi:hypothetical protein
MNTTTAFALTLAVLTATVQAAPPTETPITRADLGAQWPLTVDAGVVGCERGKAIKLVAGGKTYALNGTAQAYSKQLGFGWQPVAAIWRDNPDIPGTKVSIAPLIAKGQALCRPWP